MTRPQKKNPTAQLQIPVEDFLRTRDSVVSSLTTLQQAINNLLTKYIQHTNTVLGGEGSDSLDTLALSNQFSEVGAAGVNLLGGATGGAAATSPLLGDLDLGVKLGKKKRAKKPKDPNEPKKPLTAYFLFTARARDVVKQDLGEDAKAADVAAEVLKRWQEMPESDKEKWKEVYQKEREQYVEKMKQYKASQAASGINTNFEADDDDEPVGNAVLMIPDAQEAETTAGAPIAAVLDSDSAGAAGKKAPAKPRGKAAAAAAAAPAAKAKTTTTAPGAAAKGKRGRGSTAQDTTPAVAAVVSPATAVPLPGAEATATKAGGKRKSAASTAKDKEADEPKKKRSRKSKGAEEEDGAAKKDKRKRKSDASVSESSLESTVDEAKPLSFPDWNKQENWNSLARMYDEEHSRISQEVFGEPEVEAEVEARTVTRAQVKREQTKKMAEEKKARRRKAIEQNAMEHVEADLERVEQMARKHKG